MRKALAIGLLLALAIVPAALAARRNGARGRTVATVYQAFSYHGVIVPRVSVASGSCFTSSDVTPRMDAWRCLVGNELLDPCFSSKLAGGIVVCPTPWSDTGVEIHLTKPLPAAATHTQPSLKLEPWAVQTASGAECILASGASSLIDGRRLNYFCGAHAKYGLWGLPNRSRQPWTIFRAALSARRLTRRVALARAWM